MIGRIRLLAFIVVTAALLVCWAPAARAQGCPPAITQTPETLAKGIAMPVPAAGATPYSITATDGKVAATVTESGSPTATPCTLTVDDGLLQPASPGSCPGLFSPVQWSTATLHLPPAACNNAAVDVTVTRATALELTGRYTLAADRIELEELSATPPPAPTTLNVLYVNPGDQPLWIAATNVDPSKNVFAASHLETTKELVAFGRDACPGGTCTYYRLTLKRDFPLHTCPSVPLKNWCFTKGMRRSELVCVDSTQGGPTAVRLPTAGFLRPNYGTTVVVLHCQGDTAAVTQDGTPGPTVASTDDAQSLPNDVKDVQTAAQKPNTTPAEISVKADAMQRVAAKLKQSKDPKTGRPAFSSSQISSLESAASEAKDAADTFNKLGAKEGATAKLPKVRKAAEAAKKQGKLPKGFEVTLQHAEGVAAGAGATPTPASNHALSVDADRLVTTAVQSLPVKAPDEVVMTAGQFKEATEDDKKKLEASDKMVGATNTFNAVAPTLSAQAQQIRDEAPLAIVTRFNFEARQPGPTNLQVRVGDMEQPFVIELSVVAKTIVAVRVGLGLVLGQNAVKPIYGALTPSGSSTAVVTETNKGGAATELVLGVAPFVFDYIAWGGRSYESHDTAFVAPYLGVGVISGQPGGVSTFSSFYGGLECEFVRHVSLAATAVVRRTTELTGGLQAGSAVTGDVPTRDGWGLGFGLVFSASPDLLEFSATAPSPSPPAQKPVSSTSEPVAGTK